MRRIFSVLFLSFSLLCSSQDLRWGDQGNGTFINPVLNADYSDPDVIRVGEKYYMVASDFNYMGIQMMESDDMVNWRLISQVYDHFDFAGWDDMKRYGRGSWAPSLRHHNGKYYVYFCTPDEGLIMAEATDPHGPWSPLHTVKSIAKWEDPCPFWDDDGKAYLGHSLVGAGPIIIHKMSADGHELLDDGVTVYTGPVAEGTKFLKRDGWYYLVIPEGGVSSGWQTVLRSRNIYGPYEKRVVLEQGPTNINGPHQGSLVDTPDGEWWFYHFQETRHLGRVVHLQPVRWIDGWPMCGTDSDLNGTGEPLYVSVKPQTNVRQEPSLPQSSDEFDGNILTWKGQRHDALGLQWQWNHNADHSQWSLDERKGWLTLHANAAESLKTARNTLTQKAMGYRGEATTLADCQGMAEGSRMGIAVMGSRQCGVGVCKRDGRLVFYREDNGEVEYYGTASKRVWLRAEADGTTFKLSYSTDGKRYHAAGQAITITNAYWKGPRLGLYCYSTGGSQGKAQFDFFRYKILE